MKQKVVLFGCGTTVAIIIILAFATPFGKGVRDLIRSGVFVEGKQEKLTANLDEQLKMIHAAAMTYHQSEEKFPEAATWMDDLLKRMQTQNLLPGEAEKKLIRPDLASKPGAFGFSINKKAAGKYKGDLKDESLILFFTSKSEAKNAAGNPSEDATSGGVGISISGTIVNLP